MATKKIKRSLTLADGLPTPGSVEAFKKGCTCPIGLNNCGRWPTVFGPESWWISDNCDFHHHRRVEYKSPRWRKYHCNILGAVSRGDAHVLVRSSSWDVTRIVRHSSHSSRVRIVHDS